MKDVGLETDLVIVGGGLAGHRAALEAARCGAEAVILEKMPEVGGSTVMSGGSFAFAGTDMQKAWGIDDSNELLRKDLLEVGNWVNVPSLVDVYVENQLAEYHFLRGLGIEFTHVQASSGHSAPRSHRANPRTVINVLNEEVRRTRGLSIRLSTSAERLERSPDGRISHVVARSGSEVIRIRARKGVVLASGGFARSEELLRLFVPQVMRAIPGGGLGNTGDGLRMAWEHGAAFADMGYVKGTFGTYYRLDPGELPATIFPIYRGAIAVNKQGKRFIDESKPYKTIGEACLLQEDALAFQIFDQKVMQSSIADVPSFNFEAVRAKGRIVEAGSIAELADKLGLPKQALCTTVDEYNEDVRRGVDRYFGRRTLTHTFGRIQEIDTPPFFGYPCTTMINSTYAGLRVDEKMRVLNVWGEPIAGLFAAGEIIGGFHGESYMTGSSLVKALVFGRIAARSALSD